MKVLRYLVVANYISLSYEKALGSTLDSMTMPKHSTPMFLPPLPSESSPTALSNPPAGCVPPFLNTHLCERHAHRSRRLRESAPLAESGFPACYALSDRLLLVSRQGVREQGRKAATARTRPGDGAPDGAAVGPRTRSLPVTSHETMGTERCWYE